jgi:hypothetical protein
VRNLREPGAKGGGRRSLSVGESCRSKPVAGVFRILPQVFLGSIFTRHGREDTTREGTACVGAVGKAPCLPYFRTFYVHGVGRTGCMGFMQTSKLSEFNNSFCLSMFSHMGEDT